MYPVFTDVAVESRMDEEGEVRILGVEATLDMRLIVYEEVEMDVLERCLCAGW